MAVSILNKYQDTHELVYVLKNLKHEHSGVVCFVNNSNALDIVNNLCKVYKAPNVFMLNVDSLLSGRFNPLQGTCVTAADTFCELFQFVNSSKYEIETVNKYVFPYMMLLKKTLHEAATLTHMEKLLSDEKFYNFLLDDVQQSTLTIEEETILKPLFTDIYYLPAPLRESINQFLILLATIPPLKVELSGFPNYVTFDSLNFLKCGGALIVNSSENDQISSILERFIVYHLKNLIMENPCNYQAPVRFIELDDL